MRSCLNRSDLHRAEFVTGKNCCISSDAWKDCYLRLPNAIQGQSCGRYRPFRRSYKIWLSEISPSTSLYSVRRRKSLPPASCSIGTRRWPQKARRASNCNFHNSLLSSGRRNRLCRNRSAEWLPNAAGQFARIAHIIQHHFGFLRQP